MTITIRSTKGVVLALAAGTLASVVGLVLWIGLRDGDSEIQRATASAQAQSSVESPSAGADSIVATDGESEIQRATASTQAQSSVESHSADADSTVAPDGKPAIRRSSASMQGHSSIESLSDYADAAVIGTVKGIVGHEIDYGKKLSLAEKTQGLHGPGIPMVYYEIEVTETLQGVTDSTIVVASFDTDRVLTEEVTKLKTDQQVLLFLQDSREAPGLTLFDKVYVTVSLDNGVFDLLASGVARPRLPHYFTAFTPRRANGPLDPLNFSLDEVRAAIQSVNP